MDRAKQLREKEKNGTLNAWDYHFLRRCANDSRICRYCHPEKELCVLDYKASPSVATKNEDKKIAQLFKCESRYRHKFSPKHIEQLERANKSKRLRECIKTRLVKRLQVKLPNDGTQTPYVAYGVDPACHFCAVCCRGCVKRWHKFPKDRDLTDKEIDQLVDFVLYYITEYILTFPELKRWMTELPRTDILTERYYNPGRVEIQYTPTTWKVIIHRDYSSKRINKTPFRDIKVKRENLFNYFVEEAKKN